MIQCTCKKTTWDHLFTMKRIISQLFRISQIEATYINVEDQKGERKASQSYEKLHIAHAIILPHERVRITGFGVKSNFTAYQNLRNLKSLGQIRDYLSLSSPFPFLESVGLHCLILMGSDHIRWSVHCIDCQHNLDLRTPFS